MLVGIPRATISSGFFRVQMLIVLGLACLGFMANQSFPIPGSSGQLLGIRSGLCIAIAIVAYLGSVFWTLERRGGATRILFLETLLSLLALGVSSLAINPTLQAGAPWLFLNDLTGTLVLGGALTGMLLGHSYLTTPTMSIAPLSRINFYFGISAVLKGLTCAGGLWMAWNHSPSSTTLTWLLLRVLAGIVGPIVLSLMTWRILKYKNTQAATGVLFVGVILTFIGELAASLLQQELRLPL